MESQKFSEGSQAVSARPSDTKRWLSEAVSIMRSGLLATSSGNNNLNMWAEFYVRSVALRRKLAHAGRMEYFGKIFFKSILGRDQCDASRATWNYPYKGIKLESQNKR